MIIRTLILFCLISMTAFPVFAQPNTISYQAELNQPLNAAAVTTTLYADSSGDSVLWRDVTVASTGANNVLDLALGSTALDPLPALNGNVWLGITIGLQPELRPLSLITTVPFAIVAQRLSTPYIRSATVNGFAWPDSLKFESDSVTGYLKLVR